MPTDAEHRIKYEDNRRVLTAHNGLDQTSECWAAVVAFYASLHLVERLAAFEGKHLVRHVGPGSREMFLRYHSDRKAILGDYTALRRASEQARYESLERFQISFPPTTMRAKLIDGCLHRIENHVFGFLPSIPPAAGS